MDSCWDCGKTTVQEHPSLVCVCTCVLCGQVFICYASEDLQAHRYLYKCTVCVSVCARACEKAGQRRPDIPDHLCAGWRLFCAWKELVPWQKGMGSYSVKWMATPLSRRGVPEICKILVELLAQCPGCQPAVQQRLRGARVVSARASSLGAGQASLCELRGRHQSSGGNPSRGQILPGGSVTLVSAYTSRETGCPGWRLAPDTRALRIQPWAPGRGRAEHGERHADTPGRAL